ncbi:short-chain dehydrogenase/reductase SDR [Ilyonectria robusta]|uniref:short-chain dehydrogenase/reductase SDR n=1 Tax=Ilyonectria robusta TaxID=1079257 RepID=UPI001E8E80FA|nr:short-chain dehydrogenase/reductase SDR [Ilyonectria robusta]KAH8714762.1 short-chain dehydrogenase/reductase SDR [Ilyonectria robusta]
MSGVSGLRIIVAGGASGVGKALSQLLAKQGAKLVIGDVNIKGAQGVADDIVAQGGFAVAIYFDLSKENTIKNLMDAGAEKLGGLDGLVNMGADLRPETMGRDARIDDMDTDVWHRTLQVNLTGYALSTKHSLPHFLEQGKGSIVNISSMAAYGSQLTRPAYAASKAGVESLTRHTAAVRAPDNIRVNAVAFGPIATPPMLEAAKQPVVQEALARLPLRRMGRPNEAAQVVAFFLSDSSSYVTGQVLGVNGGSNLINNKNSTS